MSRRQLWRYVQRIWITLGLSATVVFAGWSLIAYRASSEAQVAIRSDSTVDVRHDDGTWSFIPRLTPANKVAFVFFPGALVSPVAYAPLLRATAAAGYPSYIVELPRRGAFGGANDPEVGQRFDRLLAQSSTPRRWVIAGHSRGGVVASQFAAERRAGFSGLVLIGTSHPRDVDLSGLTVPVIKIVGTRDGLASPGEVEGNRAKLPASTRWVWVDGGNHSQFGWYGFQPGDRRATIAAPAQRATMIRTVREALTLVVVTSPAG
jgi:pimeloyl-ACP methyl ester carboxylesterase